MLFLVVNSVCAALMILTVFLNYRISCRISDQIEMEARLLEKLQGTIVDDEEAGSSYGQRIFGVSQ